jgi:short-subunit dehydrogenase
MTSFAARYGPWALIAGASEGTGSAFAHRIAAEGVNCVLIARREGPLGLLAQTLHRQYGVECVTASIDLADENAADRIRVVAGEREIGLFISNAGSDTNSARFLDQSLDQWITLVNRNVMTVMRCCHHFAATMRERGRGGIVLVGSGAGYGGASFMAAYAGTKAFTLCFGEGLWAELRPHGVHVINLMLTRTDTPVHRANIARRGQSVPTNLASPDEVARVGLERLPFGPIHNWGEADEQAGMSSASAAARRERILFIDSRTSNVFGAGKS